jgi:hypothetical protein
VSESQSAAVHPEWVNGRRLWMDTPMRDLIAKIRFGDPIKGWEGDDRLDVYWNGIDERFELWRLEDDAQYRLVARSGEGVGFDDRVIDALVGMDNRRRQQDLATQIIEHNLALDAQRDHDREEWVAEDLAPRLHHAFREDA